MLRAARVFILLPMTIAILGLILPLDSYAQQKQKRQTMESGGAFAAAMSDDLAKNNKSMSSKDS